MKLKNIEIRKEKAKTISLHSWHNIKKYTDTHTNTQLLELINNFSKVAECRINMQNQLCFYTPAMNNVKIKFIDRFHL